MKTIYYNGVIYTGELPLQQAFVEENGYFLYAGDTETAKSMADEGDSLIDLEGRFVCSGFQDSHMHLLGFGKALQEAQLAKHTDRLEGMIEYLREFAADMQKNQGKMEERDCLSDVQQKVNTQTWLLGRGWNQDYFADVHRMPHRYDLDQVSTDIPICIVRACGHCLVVNSKALELAGITEETPQPEGGCIGMEHGALDGRFYDNAMDLIYDAIPVPDQEGIKSMIRTACKALNSYGITSCQTDDYCTFRQLPWESVHNAYRELEAAGELTVRIYEQSNLTSLEELKAFVEAGNRTGAGTDLFQIGPLKMLGDGALGARTAYLSVPYADEPSTRGIPVFTRKTMEEMIAYAHEAGMQVAVHTIGDACLDWVLGAFEKVLKAHPRADHRHGIVHCQITRADQLEKIMELKLHVYAQTIFLDYDIHIVEQRVGKELASTSYRWKTLMNKGVSVSNGSDCPVELPDVMAGIQCAVTRMPLPKQGADSAENESCYSFDSENSCVPYLPEEAFTVQEALDSYTIRAAEGSFEEAKKGKIQPGMLADFVILEQNPFEVRAEELRNINVYATYLGGKKVYGNKITILVKK